MPEHPTLRIHSPRPDILVVADERKRLRFMERTCIRLSGLMIVSSLFVIFFAIITNNVHFAIFACVLLVLAYFSMEISKIVHETHESTPTRDDLIESIP